MSKTKVLLFVLVLVIAPLAGCSGSSDEPASPTNTDPATTTTETATATQTAMVTATPTSTQTQTATATPSPPTPQPTATTTPTETVSPTSTTTATTTTTTETPTASLTPPQTTTQHSDPASPIDGGTARQATVIEVTDGDTVDVRFANGETATVRLLGVDTPEPIVSNMDPNEYGIPDTARGRDWLLNWADKASAFATTELAGEQILVVSDPTSDNRGYYGRLLAYIYVDGTNFGKQLVQRGYARVYTGGEFVLENEYLDFEATAQATDKGLWAFEEEQTPSRTPTPAPTDTPAEDGGW